MGLMQYFFLRGYIKMAKKEIDVNYGIYETMDLKRSFQSIYRYEMGLKNFYSCGNSNNF